MHISNAYDADEDTRPTCVARGRYCMRLDSQIGDTSTLARHTYYAEHAHDAHTHSTPAPVRHTHVPVEQRHGETRVGEGGHTHQNQRSITRTKCPKVDTHHVLRNVFVHFVEQHAEFEKVTQLMHV